MTVAFVYPFVWLVSASLKPRSDVFDNRLIPETLTFDNYVEVWNAAPMAAWLFNTAFVTVMATLTVTISSAMVAWGFSYFRFRGREALFGLVLATMMLPGAVTLVPQYLIWKNTGLLGTTVPLWGMNLFGSAFYIFLQRQFFLGLPMELEEAARVDGARPFRVFFTIILPLLMPVLATATILICLYIWNDVFYALFVVGGRLDTLPLNLYQVASAGLYLQNWHLIFSYIILMSLPLLLVFVFAQRKIISGITSGAVK